MRNIRIWIWGVGAVIVVAILAASYIARQRTPATADAMAAALREQAIALKPADLGLQLPAEPRTAYGVVLDMSLTDGKATLVALSTGDASIYFSTGGGMLSGGSDTAVAEAARSLVAAGQASLSQLKAGDTAPPARGNARITVLTTKGPLTATARERSLSDGSHRLSGLYYKANGVVTALRESGNAP